MEETKTKRKLPIPTIILSVAVVALAVALVWVVFLRQEPEGELPDDDLRIGYAVQGVTVTEDDPDALNRALDAAYDQEHEVMLEYRNDAFSENGTDFSCYIANAIENGYDMFIAIYADDSFEDELFVSRLLRPGTAFEEVTLNRALNRGTNTVYVAFTQVEEVDGVQGIHAQQLVTMEFHVA